MTEDRDALVDERRHAELYDDALLAEDKASGALVPGFARRAALRAMASLASERAAILPPTTSAGDGELVAQLHDLITDAYQRGYHDGREDGVNVFDRDAMAEGTAQFHADTVERKASIIAALNPSPTEQGEPT